jgi:NADH-quinone oxidoreductase subunit G
MNLMKLTIDGKTVEASPGTLVIDAAKRAGIGIPSFCYYEGLTLQGACRLCLVEVEKAPKLMTACTLPVAEGMVIRTNTPQVAQARKAMLEFVLTNHPLDCPVCDKGGECELQDATLTYGAGEGRFEEFKQHFDELQWSPVVYYDRPRCILCFRCVRICDEGMGVRALGVADRACPTKIIPNTDDHLECDECGMCIDICPVGALTSGMYRYKTRPWEMNHVGTICTHCADGCKTTLGVQNNTIMRGNNRDSSGINGEFLCIKGRYACDFNHHPERLQSPLMRVGDRLEPVSWSKAMAVMVEAFQATLARKGTFGVIGSNHTTNEENYALQKFARMGLATNNIDHHRTGDVVTLVDALSGKPDLFATTSDLYTSKAILVAGNDLAQQHSFLSFQIRANWRHHQCHIYSLTRGPVREDHYATRSVRIRDGEELAGLEMLREQLQAEPELVIVFGDAFKGPAVRQLVSFGDSLGVPVKYVCLLDYSNSRGAADMGMLPDLLPGYRPVSEAGMRSGLTLPEMLHAELDVLWVVGANPLKNAALTSKNGFLVVQDLFLTETARAANIVLPAASQYEKEGTVTNVCGEVQRVKRAAQTAGTKSDLEIFRLISLQMKLNLGISSPDAVLNEIRNTVLAYAAVPLSILDLGGAVVARPLTTHSGITSPPALIQSAGDTLFTSGTLGRYSSTLSSVLESPGQLYGGASSP